MMLRALFVVLVMTVVAMHAAAAEKERRPARSAQPALPVKLTNLAIRSEERLYRTTPQGKLFLHVYYPPDWKRDDARPAIVFFFGGAWRTGSYRQFVPQAEYFASRGLVAMSADYRIRTKHKTTPDKSVEDARSAIRWVRAHAGELGVDSEKIIAAGGSAGGHLAATTAMLEDFDAKSDDTSISCRPAALVLFNPVVDLTKLREETPASALSADLQKRLSPLLSMNISTPPAVLFYGTKDKFLMQGEMYAAKANELGVRADYYLAPDVPHGFFNRSPWTEVTTKKADEFLTSLGYLKGPSTIKLPADAPRLEQR